MRGFFFILCLSAYTALDSSIINVLGELGGDVYGIAWDKRAFMLSDDRGATWMAISYAQFAKVKADPNFDSALEVPWVKDSTPLAAMYPQLATPDVSYQQVGFGGTKTYGGWSYRLKYHDNYRDNAWCKSI